MKGQAAHPLSSQHYILFVFFHVWGTDAKSKMICDVLHLHSSKSNISNLKSTVLMKVGYVYIEVLRNVWSSLFFASVFKYEEDDIHWFAQAIDGRVLHSYISYQNFFTWSLSPSLYIVTFSFWISLCLILQLLFRMEIHIPLAWAGWVGDLGCWYSWLGIFGFRFGLYFSVLVPFQPLWIELSS